MIHLAEYRTHKSVEELKATEKAQISKNKLNGNVRKVYERIVAASFGNLGACSLKAQTIADDLGISRSTVTRCIKILKDLNVIEVHSNSKGNGIKGANIYSIIFLNHGEPSNEPSEMSHRDTRKNAVTPTHEHVETQTESFSFNPFSNHFVNFVNKNVSACEPPQDLRLVLQNIYSPQPVEGNQAFEELCKIAFGRLKQYMRTHNIPYLQMVDIITNCMRQLVNKRDVRNQFAMYSAMIKRQVEQLFEPNLTRASNNLTRTEHVPEWFEQRNEPQLPSTNNEVDFEAERAKILAKLGVS